MNLRATKPEDFDFLYCLHRAAIKDYVAQIWGWDEAWQEERFRQQFNPSAYQIIISQDQDVGMLSVRETPSEIFLSNIEVLPEFQGQGIGSSAIRLVLEDAERRGKPVMLQVLKINPARRLYERLGFWVIGETATHYLMKAVLNEAT
jgi:ribosomal protein S18 acetylase RimI-like enzyme